MARRARIARHRSDPHDPRRVRECQCEPAERRRSLVERRRRVPRALPAPQRLHRADGRRRGRSRTDVVRDPCRRNRRYGMGRRRPRVRRRCGGYPRDRRPARVGGRRSRSAAGRPARQRVRPAALDRHRRGAVHAPVRSAPRPPRGSSRHARPRAGHLWRRRRHDGSARRDPRVGARGSDPWNSRRDRRDRRRHRIRVLHPCPRLARGRVRGARPRRPRSGQDRAARGGRWCPPCLYLARGSARAARDRRRDDRDPSSHPLSPRAGSD